MSDLTSRMQWFVPNWHADWQKWQQQFKDMMANVDSDVFGAMDSIRFMFKTIPNCRVVNTLGVYTLEMSQSLVLASRTFNTLIEIDSAVPLILAPNNLIVFSGVPGVTQTQTSALELRPDGAEITLSIQILGFVDENYNVNFYNGSVFSVGDDWRQMFSFKGTGTSETLTHKVKANSADTTEEYLESKVLAGTGITVAVEDFGGIKRLRITSSISGDDKMVRISGTDTTSGYLGTKVVAGAGIKNSITTPSGDARLVFEYGDANTIMVKRGVTASASGAALVAAYAAARTYTPNGVAKSATNRVKIVLLPGDYEIAKDGGNRWGLNIDTDFIDITCEEEARRTDWGISPSAATIKFAGARIVGTAAQAYDTLHVSADDVVIRGVHADSTGTLPVAAADAASARSMTVGTGTKIRMIGCSFDQAGSRGPSVYQTGSCSIYMEECHSAKTMFEYPANFDGTAVRCSTVSEFVGYSTGGDFEGCHAGQNGFAGSASSPHGFLDGVRLVDCVNWSGVGFGNGVLNSATLIRCDQRGNAAGFGVDGGWNNFLFECKASQLLGSIGIVYSWNGKIHNCHFKYNGAAPLFLTQTEFEMYNSSISQATGAVVDVIQHFDPNSSMYCSIRESSINGRLHHSIINMAPAAGSPTAFWDRNVSSAPSLYSNEIRVAEVPRDSIRRIMMLRSALSYAINMTPGGEPRSATNRVSVYAPAGVYGSFLDELTSDHDFIDLIGVGTATRDKWDSVPVIGDMHHPSTVIELAGSSAFRVSPTCTDFRFKGIHFRTAGASGYVDTGDKKGIIFEDCSFENTDIFSFNVVAEISATNPCRVRYVSNHNFATGDITEFSDTGIDELDGKAFRVLDLDTDEIELIGVDGSGFTPSTSGASTPGWSSHGAEGIAVSLYGAENKCTFRRCNFIGSVSTGLGSSNGCFAGSMVDCSVVGQCHENGLRASGYVENVRVSGDGFLTIAETSGVIEAGSVIKNTKVWGRLGFGYRPSAYAGIVNSFITLIDCEFFGYYGFSGYDSASAAVMRGSMTRVKALNLQQSIRVQDAAILDECEIAQNVSTQHAFLILDDTLGTPIFRKCLITRIGTVNPSYWGIGAGGAMQAEISYCTFRNCEVSSDVQNVLGTGFNVEI